MGTPRPGRYIIAHVAPEVLGLAAQRPHQEEQERKEKPGSGASPSFWGLLPGPVGEGGRSTEDRGGGSGLIALLVGAAQGRGGARAAGGGGGARRGAQRGAPPPGGRRGRQRRHPQRGADRDEPRVLFRFAHAPEQGARIARGWAIPPKRTDTFIFPFLTREGMDGLAGGAAAADGWHGRRDHARGARPAQSGPRVRDDRAPRMSDTHRDRGPHVYRRGRGRREVHPPHPPPPPRAHPPARGKPRPARWSCIFHSGGQAHSGNAVSPVRTEYVSLGSPVPPQPGRQGEKPANPRERAARPWSGPAWTRPYALWVGPPPPLVPGPLHAEMKLKQQAADRLTPPGKPPGRYHGPEGAPGFPRETLTVRPPDSYAASAARNPPAAQGRQTRRGITTASAYWHSLATLARWCRIRSYLDSAAAHGITVLDAIRAAIEGRPWLPPLPALS